MLETDTYLLMKFLQRMALLLLSDKISECWRHNIPVDEVPTENGLVTAVRHDFRMLETHIPVDEVPTENGLVTAVRQDFRMLETDTYLLMKFLQRMALLLLSDKISECWRQDTYPVDEVPTENGLVTAVRQDFRMLETHIPVDEVPTENGLVTAVRQDFRMLETDTYLLMKFLQRMALLLLSDKISACWRQTRTC